MNEYIQKEDKIRNLRIFFEKNRIYSFIIVKLAFKSLHLEFSKYIFRQDYFYVKRLICQYRCIKRDCYVRDI